jgi:hypothetical protein
MAVSSFNMSDADVSRLMKTKFGPKSEMMWLLNNPMTNLMAQKYDMEGNEVRLPNPLSLAASASTNVIPHYNRPKVEHIVLVSKKAYSVTEIDRRTYKQGTSAASYLNGFKGQIEAGIQAFGWNWERMLAGDGSGKLGTIKASAGFADNGGGLFDIVISDATWVLANWEVNGIVNIGAADTSLFSIEAVTPATKTISVKRFTGGKVPANSDPVFNQNAENADLIGFAGATDNVGSKYGIPVQYRWSSERTDALGAAISTDVLEAHSMAFEVRRGKSFTHLFMSYEQFGRLKGTIEPQKRYTLGTATMPRKGDLSGKLSWTGLEFMTNSGPAMILPWRFCPPDRVYSAYMPDLASHHSPGGPQWVDEEGSVWKPMERPKDGWYAYYASYPENYIPPPSAGVVFNLALP